MMKIVLLVLVAGCVASQSTTDDNEMNESPLDQLHQQIDKLEQHQQQMTQVLHLLVDQHQQQFDKLNELRTILTDGLRKLGIVVDTCVPRNLTARDDCGARESGEFLPIR